MFLIHHYYYYCSTSLYCVVLYPRIDLQLVAIKITVKLNSLRTLKSDSADKYEKQRSNGRHLPAGHGTRSSFTGAAFRGCRNGVYIRPQWQTWAEISVPRHANRITTETTTYAALMAETIYAISRLRSSVCTLTLFWNILVNFRHSNKLFVLLRTGSGQTDYQTDGHTDGMQCVMLPFRERVA